MRASSVVGALVSVLAALTCACSGTSFTPELDAPDDACIGAQSSALRTCAKGPTLRGIDVSAYQGIVAWPQVKAAGHAFVFVRVSDGLHTIDSKFASNWPATKQAGLVRGVYQFFRPAQDPTEQAALMLDRIAKAGGLAPGDLPPVLDLETLGGLPAATVLANAKTWLAVVEAAVGHKPIVYTAAFMSSVVGSALTAYPLWVANYGVSCPLMPGGWTEWKFWQDSGSGSSPGIQGAVDLDFFNGTMPELAAMTLVTAPSAPSAPPAVNGTAEVATVDVSVVGGAEGATMGSGGAALPDAPGAASAAPNPCGR